MDFTKENAIFLVAKCINEKIKMIIANGVLKGVSYGFVKFNYLSSEGFEIMGLVGSNRLGVYEIDFGWGRPAKVDIMPVDRGLTIDLVESKYGKGGIEGWLVLNKHEIDLFRTLFLEGLCIN